MPSQEHQILIELFRNQPTLAPTLLRSVLHTPLPVYTHVNLESVDLSQLAPTQFHADAVITLRQGSHKKPALSVIVEVQRRWDAHKKWVWPAYVGNLRKSLQCEVILLVIAPRASVARRCAQPIGNSTFFLQPQVLSHAQIPLITRTQQALQQPELLVLSALAHGRSEQARAIATAARPMLEALDSERSKLYYHIIRSALTPLVRKEFDQLMLNYEVKSPLAKRFIAEGKAQSVLTVLQARGLEVPQVLRERILACTDLKQLDQWIAQASIAQFAQELLPKS